MSDAQLLAELVGLGQTLANAMDAMPGFVPCAHAFGELIAGIDAYASGADASGVIDSVRARAEHISDHRGVPQGEAVVAAGDEPSRADLLAAVVRVGSDAAKAGDPAEDVCVFLARACAALGRGANDGELEDLLARSASL